MKIKKVWSLDKTRVFQIIRIIKNKKNKSMSPNNTVFITHTRNMEKYQIKKIIIKNVKILMGAGSKKIIYIIKRVIIKKKPKN